ncbi:hypothetical protein H0H92_011601 [Tricholoma furcatifolium]|nr:hypothetical protein H0H92_011601 [Tricholoma furcatifolium]
MAMDFLAIQASSVPSERVFSSAAETDTSRRNRIRPLLMEALQTIKFSIRQESCADFTSEYRVMRAEELEIAPSPLDTQHLVNQLVSSSNKEERDKAMDEILKIVNINVCNEVDSKLDKPAPADLTSSRGNTISESQHHLLNTPLLYSQIPPNATTPAAMDLDHLSIHPPFTNDTNELDMDMEPPRPSPSMPQTLHIDIEGTGQIGGDQDDEQPEEQEYAPQQQSASNSFC